MKKSIVIMTIIGSMISMGSTLSWASDHRIGAGVRYWGTIAELDKAGIEQYGLSLIGSYQYQLAAFSKLEADLEAYAVKIEGASKLALTPQAYFLLGKALYAGVGGGFNYLDGNFGSPFFAVRAGIDLEILPTVALELNFNYQFQKWNMTQLEEEITANTIRIAALIRLGL